MDAKVGVAMKLGIGSVVFLHDSQTRVYRKNTFSGPEEWGHWRPAKIVGETTRSWVLEGGRKLPKSGVHGAALSPEHLALAVWAVKTRAEVQAAVARLTWGVDGTSEKNLRTLQSIARLVGVSAEPPTFAEFIDKEGAKFHGHAFSALKAIL